VFWLCYWAIMWPVCKESGWYETNTDLFQMFCMSWDTLFELFFLNLTYPGYNTVWLYGWNMLFVLCGCMVEAPYIDCMAVWLRCAVCIVWLYAWGTLFMCGSVFEVCCVAVCPDISRLQSSNHIQVCISVWGTTNKCWDYSVQWAVPLSPSLPTFRSLFIVMFLIWYI
jgi:hypothetical protein